MIYYSLIFVNRITTVADNHIDGRSLVIHFRMKIGLYYSYYIENESECELYKYQHVTFYDDSDKYKNT